jgi:anti-anti-sigma regulatory factor
MLRIHHAKVTSKVVCLIVEGDLVGPWVEELRRTCEPFVGNGRKLTVDLSAVLFADRQGVDLLKHLSRSAVHLECSAFLVEMLGDSLAAGPRGEEEP